MGRGKNIDLFHSWGQELLVHICWHSAVKAVIAGSMRAYPHHDPWKRLWVVKSCKGEMRVPDMIIGTNRLREITLIENPRSFNVAEFEHRASKFVL